MSDHNINKKLGLTYVDQAGGSFTLGSTVEVSTTDKDLAEKFMQQSIVRDAISRMTHFMFGSRIEKNTVDTLVLASNKIQALKDGNTIYEIPLKFSVSLLESAGLEDSTFLRDRWSNLLANAATHRQETSTAFIYILKELDDLDVKFLDLLFALYERDESFSKIKNLGYTKQSFISNLNISEEDYENITDNLLRLNLIKTGDGDSEEAKDNTHTAFHHKKGMILFTYLGLSFVRACIFDNPTTINNNQENAINVQTVEAPPARFG